MRKFAIVAICLALCTAARGDNFPIGPTSAFITLGSLGLSAGATAITVNTAGTGYVPGENVTLSIPGATVQSPTGLPFYASAIANIINTKVISATVAAGGTTCSGVTATLTGTTGTGGSSFFFTATAPISGGAITNPVTITAGGQYQVNPTSLSAEPVTGSSCSGAQLSLTMGALYAVVQNPGSFSAIPGASGVATQASTSGSGTGATFGVNFGAWASFVAPLDQTAPATGFNAQGSYNHRSGYKALGSVTSANQSTAFGWQACSSLTSGNACTAVGVNAAGSSTTATNNTAVGTDALRNVTTGGSNTAIGVSAGLGVGTGATGTGNIFIGPSSGAAFTTASSNVVVGNGAALALTTGAGNTIIGFQAAKSANFSAKDHNTIIGGNVGSATLGGHRNIVIGTDSNCDLANATNDTFMICETSPGTQPLFQGSLANASLGVQNGGTVADKSAAATLANGLNSNIALTTSYIRIAGPTGAFSLGGFAPNSVAPNNDGQRLVVYNSTAQAMTIVNEDASSTAANRIKTLTGSNVILRTGTSSATFIYDTTDSRWILTAQN